MRILNNLSDVSKNPKAVTVGNFDGIHKGHQALIKKTKEISTKNNVESMIFTFNKLPKEISLFETILITVNDYFVNKFLEIKISYKKLTLIIIKILNMKEFQKYKKIKPKNIEDIYRLRDYVSLKMDSLSI